MSVEWFVGSAPHSCFCATTVYHFVYLGVSVINCLSASVREARFISGKDCEIGPKRVQFGMEA